MDEARAVQSVANKAIATVLRNGVLPACKHLISLYGVPYGECREPFMPLDDEAKNDRYENLKDSEIMDKLQFIEQPSPAEKGDRGAVDEEIIAKWRMRLHNHRSPEQPF